MNLEKYEDKNKNKRKVLFLSLGVIVLVSVSLLLYKTFASFTETVEFPMMNGKVDYFGNSDVYFAFYKGEEQLGEMPQKGNEEGLIFERGECDNGASILWNESEWAPLVKNLSSTKTRCSLYFKEATPFVKEVVKCGQGGTSATTCITNNAGLDESLIADDYSNLRYTGATPNNYVSFNDGELWRIIGIFDGKLKIIRNESIGKIKWYEPISGSSRGNWRTSSLQEYLNNTYKINSDLVVDANWGVGTADDGTAQSFYSAEQSDTWLGKVGLISVSDYAYAVGKNERTSCLSGTLYNYSASNCAANDWLLPSDEEYWTITTPNTDMEKAYTFTVSSGWTLSFRFNNSSLDVFPSVYLNETTRITGGTGEEGSPFILEK